MLHRTEIKKLSYARGPEKTDDITGEIHKSDEKPF